VNSDLEQLIELCAADLYAPPHEKAAARLDFERALNSFIRKSGKSIGEADLESFIRGKMFAVQRSADLRERRPRLLE
jgi:hypothetical protein